MCAVSVSRRLSDAVLRACCADVEAFKPGNVAIGAPAHRMTAEHFLRSAEAVCGPLSDPGLSLGERIETAVDASWAAAGCNTNLGIVLLLAPLCEAALHASAPHGQGWRDQLPVVLANTTIDDGVALARAIVRASPAGLGNAGEGDVTASGFALTLLQAMALAAGRDQIARQYSTGFAEVLAAAAYFAARVRAGATREDALTAVFLRGLATEADTHIVRKHGAVVAEQVKFDAARCSGEIPDPPHWKLSHICRILTLDSGLRLAGINPGTWADLSVAAVFATELDEMQNT